MTYRPQRRPATPVPARLQRLEELLRAKPPSLADISLEIARDEYPELDAEGCRGELLRLRRQAAAADPGPGEPSRARLEALNAVLFREAGFAGDPDYGTDPRSSYLNEVLARRVGLPIILSVIYLEVGRSVGLPLEGVGMPAHFIVRLMGEDPAVFIDPFHGGEILDEGGCGELLTRITRGRLELQPEFLRPWPPLRIVDRMLHNLKSIYAQIKDYRRARRVVDQILVLHPDSADEIRDRGMLAYQAMLFTEAAADLETYLERAPRARDATAIRSQLQSLRRLLPSTN